MQKFLQQIGIEPKEASTTIFKYFYIALGKVHEFGAKYEQWICKNTINVFAAQVISLPTISRPTYTIDEDCKHELLTWNYEIKNLHD